MLHMRRIQLQYADVSESYARHDNVSIVTPMPTPMLFPMCIAKSDNSSQHRSARDFKIRRKDETTYTVTSNDFYDESVI